MVKDELEARYDYTPLAAFRSVDRYNIGRIDSVNLSTFLRANNHNPAELELLAIIRRIDTDGDACLDYNEFSEFLREIGKPLSRPPPSGGSPQNGNSPLREKSPGRGPRVTFSDQVNRIQPPPPNQGKKPVLRVSDEDELVHALRE